MKKIISWIIAISAAIVVFLLLWQIVFQTVKLIFNIEFIVIVVLCIVAIAAPIYMIISKRFLK